MSRVKYYCYMLPFSSTLATAKSILSLLQRWSHWIGDKMNVIDRSNIVANQKTALRPVIDPDPWVPLVASQKYQCFLVIGDNMAAINLRQDRRQPFCFHRLATRSLLVGRFVVLSGVHDVSTVLMMVCRQSMETKWLTLMLSPITMKLWYFWLTAR